MCDHLANRNAVKLANHSTGFRVNCGRRGLSVFQKTISGLVTVSCRKSAKQCRQDKNKHEDLEERLFVFV